MVKIQTDEEKNGSLLASLLAKYRWSKATDAEKAEQSRLMHEGRWGKKRKKAKS